MLYSIPIMQPRLELPARAVVQSEYSNPTEGSVTDAVRSFQSGISDAPVRTAAMTTFARTPALASLLLVEDEESLRLPVSKMLRCRGWSVLEAANGAIALDLIYRHRVDIHVILLDMTLPGTSSRTVLEESRRCRPDTKVVLTSAFALSQVDAALAGLHKDGYIRKPYRLHELTEVLSKVLEAPSCGCHSGSSLY